MKVCTGSLIFCFAAAKGFWMASTDGLEHFGIERTDCLCRETNQVTPVEHFVAWLRHRLKYHPSFLFVYGAKRVASQDLLIFVATRSNTDTKHSVGLLIFVASRSNTDTAHSVGLTIIHKHKTLGRSPNFRGLTIKHGNSTIGRSPQEEWSAWRRKL